jgi:hypothetical protein
VAGTDRMGYSTDNALTWTESPVAGFGGPFYGVAYNGVDMWVAVGDSASHTLAYSADGITWTPNGITTFSAHASDVVFGAGVFVAIGSGLNRLAYSSDGIAWTGIDAKFDLIISDTVGVAGDPSLAWNGHMFIASTIVLSEGNPLYYSYDGINWGRSSLGLTLAKSLGASMGAAPTEPPLPLLIAGGNETGVLNHSMLYSYDAVTWQPVPYSDLSFTPAAVFGVGVAYNGVDAWVSTGQKSTINATYSSAVCYSYDGFRWTSVRPSAAAGRQIPTTTGHRCIYADGKFIVCGTGTYSISYSTDGILWDASTNATTVMTTAHDVAYNGVDLFVFVGLGTQFGTSVDGTSIVAQTSPFTFAGYAIEYGNGVFVAVGRGGTDQIATSTDGITWTGRGSYFNGTDGAYGVAYDGTGRWVVVGYATPAPNSIAYSDDDGATWTGLGNSVFSILCRSVTYSATLSLWIATGRGTNCIATSPDGINWTGQGHDLFSTEGTSIYARA